MFYANSDAVKYRSFVATVTAQCQSRPTTCPPPHIMDLLRAKLAEAEAKLAEATAGRALTLASCEGYYGRVGQRYTRFRCEATLVGQTWKTGAAMVYAFGLRPGGWNGRPTKHGFRVLGLRLMPAA